MKVRLLGILVVFALATVSLAQKPRQVDAFIAVDPTIVRVGETVNIQVFVTNMGSKSITIREIELYCGTKTHSIWEDFQTFKRVTVNPGEMRTLTTSYRVECGDVPESECMGGWNLQAWICFGGSGKTDLVTTEKTLFTVIP